MDLELFGLVLPVANGKVGDYVSGDVTLRVVDSTVTANRVAIEAEVAVGTGRDRCRLSFELTFKVDVVGNIIRPADGVQPKPIYFIVTNKNLPGSSDPIVIENGPFLFSMPDILTRTLQARGGKLFLHLTGTPRRWFAAEGCGLFLSYGMGGVTVDLGRGLLITETEFLLAEFGTTLWLADGSQTTLFQRLHNSNAFDLPLRSPPSTANLRFTPASNDAVALHSELASEEAPSGPSNPVIAAVGLSNHQFELTFGVGRLERVRALPKRTAFQLRTYFLSSPKNEHQVWKCSNPIDLHLRPAAIGSNPSSWMIAPITARGVQIERTGTADLHGLVDEGQIRFGDTVNLGCRLRDPTAGPANVAANIVSRATLPFFDIQGISSVAAAMPGTSYLPDGVPSSAVSSYLLERNAGTIPLQPRRLMRAEKASVIRFLADINASWSRHAHQPMTVRHETALRNVPPPAAPPIVLKELFPFEGNPALSATSFSLDAEARPTLAEHTVIRDYGVTEITTAMRPDANTDYIAITDPADIKSLDKVQLHFNRNEFVVSGRPEYEKSGTPGRKDRPLAIVKLSDRYTLEQIFDLESNLFDKSVPGPVGSTFELIDPSIQQRSWRGLIVFNIRVDYTAFDILKALTNAPLYLNYVAVTPKRSADTTKADFSIAGHLSWINVDPNMPTAGLGQETRFFMEKIDAAWVDSRLSSFRTEARLLFPKALGLENKEAQTPELKIVGSYDLDVFRFGAQLNKPLPILDPANGFGPIAQVYIRGAEVVQAPSGATIDLDGDIELRSLSWDEGPWVDTEPGRRIRFRKLSLSLPPLDISLPNGWRWLRFNYPSLEFDLGQRHYRLFGLDALELQLDTLGISWDNSFDWGSLWLDNGNFKNAEATLLLGLRLHLMKLPSLAALSVKKLILELMIGLRPEAGRWTSDNFKVGLRAVGFEGLHLELLRFLEINAEKLELARYTTGGNTVSYLELGDAELRILGKTIVSGLSARLYTSPDGKRRFIAYIDKVAPLGFLDIKWLLVGQNITLPEDLAKKLMSIEIDGQPDTTRTDIVTASQPEEIIVPGTGTEIGEWLFAAAFSVLGGFFEGKFLFQDKNFYGLSIEGTLFEEWFGYHFALSVLYMKRERAEEDSFYIEFTVPAVSIGTIRFTGGVIAVEVAMNGGAMLDVGFPWRGRDGARGWSRTLGAIVTPFQGSGGFYVAKRTTIQSGNSRLRLSAGYALQAGLGATYGGGIFTVWVRAGIFLVLEGEALLEGTALLGMRISGSIGILVEGGGEISWWIISARVSVFASAEAMTTLLWGIDPATGQNYGQNLTLQLDFNLVARASASACIGSGMFKICKDISVGVSMPFQQTIRIG